MPDSDPSSLLSGIREHWRVIVEKRGTAAGFLMIGAAKNDVPRLLAAIEAALSRHVEAVIEDMPGPFHYCKTCSGHPAWPCPEVAAITTARGGSRH